MLKRIKNEKLFESISVIILLFAILYSVNLMQYPPESIHKYKHIQSDNVYRFCDDYLSSDLIVCRKEMSNAFQSTEDFTESISIRRIIVFLTNINILHITFLKIFCSINVQFSMIIICFMMIMYIHKGDGKKRYWEYISKFAYYCRFSIVTMKENDYGRIATKNILSSV